MNPRWLKPPDRAFCEILQPENTPVRLPDDIFFQRPSAVEQLSILLTDFSVMRFRFDKKQRAIFSERQMVNVAATCFYIVTHDVICRKPVKQCADFFFGNCAANGPFVHRSESSSITGTMVLINFAGKNDK